MARLMKHFTAQFVMDHLILFSGELEIVKEY